MSNFVRMKRRASKHRGGTSRWYGWDIKTGLNAAGKMDLGGMDGNKLKEKKGIINLPPLDIKTVLYTNIY